MKLLLFVLCTWFLFIVPTVSVKDFKPALGKWQGTITYLDYTSGKPFSMPCNLSISRNVADPQQLIFAYEYPTEPKANGNDTLTISADGKMIDDEIVVLKEKENGVLKISADKNGVDGNDNRKAVLRYIYIIGKKTFIKRKEVKFDEEDKWIMRNEFKMNRR